MSKKILIAPLDWGLGHTTRCIPIIRKCLDEGHTVFFAGSISQEEFLRQNNILIHFLRLEGYTIQYSRFLPQWIKIAFQCAKIYTKIRLEKKWLENLLINEHFDLVISDNRYGLYSSNTTCVFLGHQLSLQSPIFKKWINRIHAQMINKFSECWIPDDEKINLSGLLSINTNVHIPIKKIGLLNRLDVNLVSKSNKIDVLILLSGTEPQRSILEKKLSIELRKSNYKIVVIRGSKSGINYFPPQIDSYHLIETKQLSQLISEASLIICRSGYSTLMELILLNKKLILIPTPGQTEQEYLAKQLSKNPSIRVIKQTNIPQLTNQINHLLGTEENA